jgi:hypothetical protein
MDFMDEVPIPCVSGILAGECIRINLEDTCESCSDNLLCSASNFRIVCSGSVLYLYKSDKFNSNGMVKEMEFDSTIDSVTWDATECCFVVGDRAGSVHLVTSEGAILFSKKIIAGLVPNCCYCLIYNTLCICVVFNTKAAELLRCTL